MINFDIKRQELNSRGLLLLRAFFGYFYIIIPHSILLALLSIGGLFINIITFWIILFTAKYPDWSWNYNVKLIRYSLRVNASIYNLTDVYPEFGLEGSHPNINFDLPFQKQQSRGRLIIRALFGQLMLLPHIIVLVFLGIGAAFVMIISWWVILFTGKYPEGMFDFIVRVMRWQLRVQCWKIFLTPNYPDFTGKIIEGENK